MHSSKILYICAHQSTLAELVRSKKTFLSVDKDEIFEVYCDGESVNKFSFYDIAFLNNDRKVAEEVFASLDRYSPIFARWYHRGHMLENEKETLAIKIIKIISLIDKFHISKAIFGTGVCHHLDAYIFETALKIKNKPQIYLYPIDTSLAVRLIPLVQTDGVKTRERLDKKLSKFTFNEVLDNYFKGKTGQRIRSNRQRILDLLRTNFYVSYCYLLIRKLYHALKLVSVKFNLLKIFKIDLIYSDETLYSDLDLIIHQRKFLTFYKKHSERIKSDLIKRKKIVIFAHHQPEATSFPESGRVYSHLFIISYLRGLGFEDTIYYKEHFGSAYYLDGDLTPRITSSPTRVGMNRSTNYCKELLKLDCKLLPINSKASELENFLPLTLTGSIAIERSLRGLRTIIAGDAWWKGLPGTISLWELEKNFSEIPDDWITPNNDIASDARAFLLDILNNKTIKNVFGFGLPIVTDTDGFQEELESLLDLI